MSQFQYLVGRSERSEVRHVKPSEMIRVRHRKLTPTTVYYTYSDVSLINQIFIFHQNTR